MSQGRSMRQDQGDREDSRPGFTLLEVVIGLSMSIVLTTIALNFFLMVNKTAVHAADRAQLNRDAQVLFDIFEHDLNFFGVGVPFGDNAAGVDLLPGTRRAGQQSLVFVGDLPYPNTEFNGIMMIGGIFTGTLRATVTSELSGACLPHSNAAAGNILCDTRRFSALGFGTVLDTLCNEANLGARTCPWGMLKWQNGTGSNVSITLNRPDGTFATYTHSADFGVGAGQLRVVGGGGDWVGVEMSAGAPFVDADSGVGSAFVQLDRVFWAIEEDEAAPGTSCTTTCAIWRRQCWGAGGGPDTAGFPSFGSTFYGTNQNPTGCVRSVPGTPGDGTAWEKIAGGLSNASFQYYQGGMWQDAVTSDANARTIRGIALQATFSRAPLYGAALSQTYRRQIMLENRDEP